MCLDDKVHVCRLIAGRQCAMPVAVFRPMVIIAKPCPLRRQRADHHVVAAGGVQSAMAITA
jgi:hypothetical protein